MQIGFKKKKTQGTLKVDLKSINNNTAFGKNIDPSEVNLYNSILYSTL